MERRGQKTNQNTRYGCLRAPSGRVSVTKEGSLTVPTRTGLRRHRMLIVRSSTNADGRGLMGAATGAPVKGPDSEFLLGTFEKVQKSRGQRIGQQQKATSSLGPAERGRRNGVRFTFRREALLDTGCKLYAYVLMDNHVHLLATPPEIGAIARLMQKLGRSIFGQFNARHRRTGTLWEGRYKASLVDSESYVLPCHRYIDLNPIRARMTDDPATYPWSSCASHCGLRQDAVLSTHPEYTALAATPEAPTAAYRQLLRETLSDDDLTAIRIYLQQQRALGRDDFHAMVEAKAQPRPGAARSPPASRQFKRL